VHIKSSHIIIIIITNDRLSALSPNIIEPYMIRTQKLLCVHRLRINSVDLFSFSLPCLSLCTDKLPMMNDGPGW